MRKGLRNTLIMAMLALPIGNYAHKKYREFLLPERINVEVLEDGTVINTYRSKAPEAFRRIEDMIQDYNTQSGTEKTIFGQNVDIHVTPIEDRARYISRNWDAFERNSKRLKKESLWEASDNLVYNLLKGIKDSEKEAFYSDEKKKIARIHELDHVKRNKENRGYTAEQLEVSAYLDSLIRSPLALEDVLYTYKYGKNPHKGASESILREFLKYPDTPEIYALCNHPRLEMEIPKRAAEIRDRLFGDK